MTTGPHNRDDDHTRDAGTAAWHGDLPPLPGEQQSATPVSQRRLYHVKAGELDPDTTQTKGMKRFEALSGRHGGTEKIWLGENHVGPGMNSGDHHPSLPSSCETASAVSSLSLRARLDVLSCRSLLQVLGRMAPLEKTRTA
jgi:hypothetical protein